MKKLFTLFMLLCLFGQVETFSQDITFKGAWVEGKSVNTNSSINIEQSGDSPDWISIKFDFENNGPNSSKIGNDDASSIAVSFPSFTSSSDLYKLKKGSGTKGYDGTPSSSLTYHEYFHSISGSNNYAKYCMAEITSSDWEGDNPYVPGDPDGNVVFEVLAKPKSFGTFRVYFRCAISHDSWSNNRTEPTSSSYKDAFGKPAYYIDVKITKKLEPAKIEWTSTKTSFGKVDYGDSDYEYFKFENTGDETAVGDIDIKGSYFSSSSEGSFSLAGGDTKKVKVYFKPKAKDDGEKHTGSIEIECDKNKDNDIEFDFYGYESYKSNLDIESFKVIPVGTLYSDGKLPWSLTIANDGVAPSSSSASMQFFLCNSYGAEIRSLAVDDDANDKPSLNSIGAGNTLVRTNINGRYNEQIDLGSIAAGTYKIKVKLVNESITYTELSNSFKVSGMGRVKYTLNPSSAKYQIYNKWYASGKTSDLIPEGDYWVTFSDVDGYVTPKGREIELKYNTSPEPYSVSYEKKRPDLMFTKAEVSPTTIYAGDEITVKSIIYNDGNIKANFNLGENTGLRYYLSKDNVFHNNENIDLPLSPSSDVDDIEDKESSDLITSTIEIPSNITPDTYYVIFYIDKDRYLQEETELSNNIKAVKITIKGKGTIKYSLDPANADYAVYFNNKWNWYDSEEKSALLPEGSYEIKFKEISGYITPANESYYIMPGVNSGQVTYVMKHPDLEVTSPFVAKTILEPGESFNASCYIQNVGNLDANYGMFTDNNGLKYYISDKPYFTDKSKELLKSNLDDVNIDTPKRKIEQDLKIPTSWSEGEYYILFYANRDKEIKDEINFDNNLTYKEISIAKKYPDFEVKDFTINRTNFTTGEPIEWDFNLYNNGDKDSERDVKYRFNLLNQDKTIFERQIEIDYDYGNTNYKTAGKIKYSDNEPCSWNGTINNTVRLKDIPTGIYYLQVEVNYDNEKIDEGANTLSNTAELLINVVGKGNLTVNILPEEIKDKVRFTLNNSSKEYRSGQKIVDLAEGDYDVHFRYFEGWKAQESRSVHVSSQNPDDNDYDFTFTKLYPDLEIAEEDFIIIDPLESYTPNARIKWQLSVYNIGEYYSDEATVKFMLLDANKEVVTELIDLNNDSDNVFSFPEIPSQNSRVVNYSQINKIAGIGPNSELVLDDKLTSGTYYIRSIINEDNGGVDENGLKSNNFWDEKIIVKAPIADLTIASVVKPTVGQIKAGEEINWECLVQNVGTKEAPASKMGIYFSPENSDFTNHFISDDADIPAIGKMETKNSTGSFIVPKETEPGLYYIHFVADNGDVVTEPQTEESSNIYEYPIEVLVYNHAPQIKKTFDDPVSGFVGEDVTFSVWVNDEDGLDEIEKVELFVRGTTERMDYIEGPLDQRTLQLECEFATQDQHQATVIVTDIKGATAEVVWDVDVTSNNKTKFVKSIPEFDENIISLDPGNKNIKLYFSEEIDKQTINADNLLILENNEEVRFTYSVSKKCINISIEDILKPLNMYTIICGEGIKNNLHEDVEEQVFCVFVSSSEVLEEEIDYNINSSIKKYIEDNIPKPITPKEIEDFQVDKVNASAINFYNLLNKNGVLTLVPLEKKTTVVIGKDVYYVQECKLVNSEGKTEQTTCRVLDEKNEIVKEISLLNKISFVYQMIKYGSINTETWIDNDIENYRACLNQVNVYKNVLPWIYNTATLRDLFGHTAGLIGSGDWFGYGANIYYEFKGNQPENIIKKFAKYNGEDLEKKINEILTFYNFIDVNTAPKFDIYLPIWNSRQVYVDLALAHFNYCQSVMDTKADWKNQLKETAMVLASNIPWSEASKLKLPIKSTSKTIGKLSKCLGNNKAVYNKALDFVSKNSTAFNLSMGVNILGSNYAYQSGILNADKESQKFLLEMKKIKEKQHVGLSEACGFTQYFLVTAMYSDNVKPSVPTSIAPINKNLIAIQNPTFKWSAFEQGGDNETQLGYQFRMLDSNDEVVVETGFIASTDDNSFVYNSEDYSGGHDPISGFDKKSEKLIDGMTYHWHVRYMDSGNDWSLWSANDEDGSNHQKFTYFDIDKNIPDLFDFGANAGTTIWRQVGKFYNEDIQFEGVPEWLEITIENQKLSLKSILSNEDLEPRTATVILSRDGLQKELNVLQNGKKPYVTVYPAEQEITSTEQNIEFISVETNQENWQLSVEGDQDWFTYEKIEGGIQLSVNSPNQSLQDKVLKMEIKADGAQTKYAAVVHKGEAPYFRIVSPESGEVISQTEISEATNEYKILPIETNLSNFEVKVDESCTWLAVSYQNSNMNLSTLQANLSTSERIGIVHITATSFTKDFLVTQQGSNGLLQFCKENTTETLERVVLDANAGTSSSESQATYMITNATYAYNSNWNEAVLNEFGDNYRVADWNDLKEMYAKGEDLLDFFDSIGLTEYNTSVSVTNNGTQLNSSSRGYFASRHEHNRPSNYGAHSNIDNYLISLGSWSGNRKILAINKNEQVQEVIEQNFTIVDINTNLSEYELKQIGDWFRYEKLENNQVKIFANSDNKEIAKRTGELIASNGNIQSTLIVEQKKAEPFLKLSAENINFINNNSEKTIIEVESNSEWYINNLPDWLSIEGNTTGEGNQQIIIAVFAANDGDAKRSTEIYFNYSGERKVLKINQAGLVDNNLVILEDQAFSIDENSVNTSVVGTIKVDNYTNDNITFNIESDIFDINANGEIIVKDESSLDYETQSTFKFMLSASELGNDNNSDAGYVSIYLDNVNDNKPTSADHFTPNAFAKKEYVTTLRFSDADMMDELSFDADENKPNWIQLVSKGYGELELSGTPSKDDVGAVSFKIKVYDEIGGEPTLFDFSTEVIDANEIPVITAEENISLSLGEEFEFDVLATDADNDPLEFTYELPEWISLKSKDDNKLTFVCTTSPNFIGNQTFSVQVTDGVDPVSHDVNFYINAIPAFTSTPLTVATVNENYEYTFVVADKNSDASLTIESVKLPEWLKRTSINANSIKLSGIPTSAGDFEVEVSVNDGIISEPIVQSFVITVGKASQTITFAELADVTYGDAAFDLTASASSSEEVSFELLSGPAKLAGNTLSITGAGDIVIKAIQEGNANYLAADAITRSFTVNKAAQVITFADLADKTYGDAAFDLTASVSSSEEVSFELLSGPATLAGNTVTITGAGDVVVKAIQDGNANYSAADAVTQTFTVNKAAQTISFAELTDKTYGDSAFELIASASSELAVSFELFSGLATLEGNVLSIKGGGQIVLKATQVGNENFLAARTITRAFIVNRATQTITFADLADKTYGDADFDLVATSSSSYEVSFELVSGPVTLIGNTLKINGAGDVVVRASQGGGSNYFVADMVTRTFTVNKAEQIITFDELADKTYGDAAFDIEATSSSSEEVSFELVSGPATLVGKTLTITGVGDVVVKAIQAGSTNYLAADAVTRTFTVNKVAQTIAFEELADKTYGDSAFDLFASASSSEEVSFEFVSGPATLAGNTLTITGAGDVVVKAIQAGNANYSAADAVSRTFTVNKAEQIITFDELADKTYGDAAFDIGATSSSLEEVSLELLSGPAALIENTLSITGVGEVTIKASQNGNENYKTAESITRSFTVNKAEQIITFDELADKTYGDAAFDIEATSSSLEEVSLELLSGPATLVGKTLSITGAGEILLKAIQAGNANYEVGEATTTIKVSKASQTITFDEVSNKTYGNDPFELHANATSGLDINFEVVEGYADIDGNMLTIINAGTITIKAIQAGNENYEPAELITRSFDIDKASQTITFNNIGDKFSDNSDAIILEATASSDLEVSFELLDGNASIEDNKLIITGSGSITIRAYQEGNDNYLPAEEIQEFTITGIDDVILESLEVYPNPVVNHLRIKLNNLNGETIMIRLYSTQGQLVKMHKQENNYGTYQLTSDMSQLSSGVYFLTIQVGEKIIKKKIIKL